MSAMPRFLPWLLLPLLACEASSPESTALGRVRLGLAADDCASFCATVMGAELFRDGESLPLGPGQSAACGATLDFDALPAGHRVRVRAWVGHETERLLEGTSDLVTVPSSATVSVYVPLTPRLLPSVATVAPEPLVLGALGGTLRLVGQRFGSGEGRSVVEGRPSPLADWSALPTVAWTDTTLDVSLPALAAVQETRVVACGVSSAVVPVRVTASAPAQSQLTPPGCTGLTLVAAAADPSNGALALAASCDTGGSLVSLRASDCSLASQATSLPGSPEDLAVASDGTRYVAVGSPANTLVRVGAMDATISLIGVPNGERPWRVASGSAVLTVATKTGTTGRLHRLMAGASTLEPVAGVAVDLTFADLAATSQRLLASANGSAGARLVVVATDPALPPVEVAVPTCGTAGAVAATEELAAPGWVALACTNAVLVGFRSPSEAQTVTALPSMATDVALDARGDVAFAVLGDGSGVALVALATGTLLTTATPGGRAPLARFPGTDRLLLGGVAPGALVSLAPYAGGAACP